ncbi:hypothetical protein BHM03_00002086 [Ensete ventricosum]|uniref:Uncharacterized protein n=1 Tax=Ensete ventricosum TaxID=4639 RepID=A0A445M9F6_ENSVE|nr:hypothetical protein BHM03_00002086 [Ensete ventricosum]
MQRLIFRCWDEVLPRSYAGRRGAALFTHCKPRRPLVFLRWDGVLPHFSAGRRGGDKAVLRLPLLGRGTASFFCWKARRCLIFLRCAEATPRSHAGRRGDASSSFVGTWDEPLLHSSVGRRSGASSHLIFLRWDEPLLHSSVGRRSVIAICHRYPNATALTMADILNSNALVIEAMASLRFN